jgi:hypothetical protein
MTSHNDFYLAVAMALAMLVAIVCAYIDYLLISNRDTPLTLQYKRFRNATLVLLCYGLVYIGHKPFTAFVLTGALTAIWWLTFDLTLNYFRGKEYDYVNPQSSLSDALLYRLPQGGIRVGVKFAVMFFFFVMYAILTNND